MNRKRIICILFVLLISCLCSFYSALSLNIGLETSEMTEEDQKTFISSINLSVVNEENSKKAFSCFDVNDSGMIALGQESKGRKYVSIYNSDGEFLYGYSFTAGQSFNISWDGSNVLICFDRSDVVISVDPQGSIVELRRIEDTYENDIYRLNVLKATSKTANGKEYVSRKNIGPLGLVTSSRAVVSENLPDGQEKIVYDATGQLLADTLLGFIIFAAFFVFVIICVVRLCKRTMKNYRAAQNSSKAN